MGRHEEVSEESKNHLVNVRYGPRVWKNSKTSSDD